MGFSTIGDFAETPAGAGSTGHEGVDDQSSSNDDQITIKDGEVVINEDGDDVDFRVESDTKTHMLFVDGAQHQVGINSSGACNKSLTVEDSMWLKGRAVFTLTGSIDPAASATVTGVGTAFLTEVSIGDQITVSGETRTVRGVASNTSLTLEAPFSDNANDTSPDCNPAALNVIKDGGTLAFAVDGLDTANFGGCFKIQTEDEAGNNQSARLFFKESQADNLYGFSQFYTGDANPVFGNTTFTAPANSFHFFRHNNSEAGDVVMTIQRADGFIGLAETTPSKMLDLKNGASGGDILAYDVYTHDGAVTSSDERMKDNITPSALGLDFVNSLNPVSYKWKDTEEVPAVEAGEGVDGKAAVPAHTYTRTHYGLIAQQVEQTLIDAGLSAKDFGGYCYEEDRDQHALRYSEFISPLIKAVQELTARVEKLENK